MMSLWRTGENLEKAEMHQSGFEHSAFFVSLWRIFKKGHGSEYCYISIVSGASKIDAIWFLYIESSVFILHMSRELVGVGVNFCSRAIFFPGNEKFFLKAIIDWLC